MTHSHITNAERGSHMKKMAHDLRKIVRDFGKVPNVAIGVHHEIMADHVEYFGEITCDTLTHGQFLIIWRALRAMFGKLNVEFSESADGVSFHVIESFWWTADEIAQVTTD